MDNKYQIKQFIQKEIINDPEDDSLEDATQLIENGIIDSLGIMKLLTFFEEFFLIKLNEDELIPENFETLTAITLLVNKKISINKDK